MALVRILFNRLPTLGDEMRTRAAEVVAKSAFDLEAHAKLNAHVLTGAMRASVYTSIAGGDSNYTTNTADASSRRPGVDLLAEQSGDFLGQAEPGLAGVVSVAVNYAVFEESRAGHAFLLPAAEAVRPAFEAAMQAIVD